MTGLVYAVVGPVSFIAGFVLSEASSVVSQFIIEEGTHMVPKAREKFRSLVCVTRKAVIASWESRLPYRQSLLMSSCNSSEKELREF